MTLGDYISKLPSNRILIRADQTVYYRDDLTYKANQAGSPATNVAFCLSDIAKLVCNLIHYDGRVKRMVLLAPSLDSELVRDLAEFSDCDSLILDTEIKHLDTKKNRVGLDGEFDKTDWVLATSGTTNTPKLVSHNLSNLSATTKTDTGRGLSQKWGMLYDPSRFAGLQVLLQSLLSGGELLAPSQDWDLHRKVDFLIEHGCTHLSCTPTLWRKIIMNPHAINMPLVQATLGGEIADQRILSVIAAKFPKARITHIYASTEAGVGFAVSDGREGFPKQFLDAAPAGMELKEKHGRLFVRNPSARERYLNSQTILSCSDGWVDTGDRIALQNDRYYFLGREGGVINVGGDKVHPEQIESFLSSVKGVRGARVYGKKNPITGALVIADIVLEDPQADKGAIRKYLQKQSRENLSRHQVPALFKFVDDIEVNASGKIIRPKL